MAEGVRVLQKPETYLLCVRFALKAANHLVYVGTCLIMKWVRSYGGGEESCLYKFDRYKYLSTLYPLFLLTSLPRLTPKSAETVLWPCFCGPKNSNTKILCGVLRMLLKYRHDLTCGWDARKDEGLPVMKVEEELFRCMLWVWTMDGHKTTALRCFSSPPLIYLCSDPKKR